MKNYNKGFIALFSVIIITSVLLLIATTLSFSGFFGRFNIFDSESKSRSKYLALACVESARLEIAKDNNFFVTNKEIFVASDCCKYSVINSSATIIEASSVINNAYTYYQVEVNKNVFNIPITSFRECVTEACSE